MSWGIGYDDDLDRFIGYGVPSICEHPDCTEAIDRGLAYACGGGVMGGVDNCGRFFCGKHLSRFLEDDTDGGEFCCERCGDDLEPFPAKPDTAEWVKHMLTDPSWRKWRDEHPGQVAEMREVES